MKCVGIIPARGGSKRIPKKNIHDFMGKPLIAWTIEAALSAKIFDRIIVSTDDREIAKVAEDYGIEVPFLRIENADDYSPVSQATISALKQAEDYFSESYENVIQLMANTPIRSAEEIIQHYTNFVEKNAPFQLSCFYLGWMNTWWSFKMNEKGEAKYIFPKSKLQRSQDMPPLFCPTGAIWIARVKALKEAETFYGANHTFYPIDWMSAVDIDDYEDLEMAKSLFKVKSNL